MIVPHLLWVVCSLLCAATSGRLLAVSLEEDDPAQSLWVHTVAFVTWCCVCVLAIWWAA
jgi:hypothetical protein